jgi:hypothetical protein
LNDPHDKVNGDTTLCSRRKCVTIGVSVALAGAVITGAVLFAGRDDKGSSGSSSPYPSLQVFTEKSMGHSVASIRQDTRTSDLYFCSPANQIFDLPGAENDSVVVVHNPVELFEGLAEPDWEYVSTAAEFPNDVLPVPLQWDDFLSALPPPVEAVTSPVVIASGRFPAGSLWADGLAGELFIQHGEHRISISGPPDLVSNKWYYQEFRYEDMNDDGLLDVLVARTVEAPPPYAGETDFFWNQLAWFEQPIDPMAAVTGPWPLHILVNEEFLSEQVNSGPGTYFDVADLDGDGVLEVAYANFWGKMVSLLHTSSWQPGQDGQLPVVEQLNLDASLDYIYDVSFGDVNNDGNLDLVVTNHAMLPEYGFGPATLAVYEIIIDRDSDTFVPTFTRHIIDQDFPGRTSPFAFSVGIAVLVQVPMFKPMIALTTDGGGDYYLYEATSQDPGDWIYSRELMGENLCDFIKPFVYTDPLDEDADSYLLAGCLGLGYIYGGRFSHE